MKPVFTSLSPHVEDADLRLSLSLLLEPRTWVNGFIPEALEDWFRDFMDVEGVWAFNSGRSALMAILSSLEEGSEVLVPGFTCNALVNAIIWSGLKPVYVDVDDSLNMDLSLVEQAVTSKTRAIIAQHTFGLPLNMEKVVDLCFEHRLMLIEDCAHALGAEYRGQKVGTFGQAAFFSLGRDKVVSSVFGGMAISKNEYLSSKIDEFQKNTTKMSYLWTMRQLIHPLLTEMVKPLYPWGRWVLGALNRTHVINKAVIQKEKRGEIPHYIPGLMPNVLAKMGFFQLGKLDRFIDHQRKIAKIYEEGLKGVKLPVSSPGRVYMRYPILTDSTDEVLKKMRGKGLYLNDGWRGTPVVPMDVDLESVGYEWGMCPRAEEVAQRIVNLPTSIKIGEDEARRIISCLNEG